MIDMLTIGRTARASWCKARLHAAGVALWSTDHPYIAWGLLYALVAYFGSAVLIGVPGRAVLALMIAGPTGWWCFCRYRALASAQLSKLAFFTGENGPLRLSEDLLSPKVVYCIGLRNEGKKAVENARVTIDGIDGHPAFAACLPIFCDPAESAALQPGESEYFCLARIIEPSPDRDGSVAICCPDEEAAPRFALQELGEGRVMTLSASSEGASPIAERIQISSKHAADAPWSLDLRLLPNEEELQRIERRSIERMPGPDAISTPAAEQASIAPTPDTDAVSTPVAEQTPIASSPVVPETNAAPMPVVEQDPAAPSPAQEPSAHSERIRLLARQARS
jgi:hypothetical protein